MSRLNLAALVILAPATVPGHAGPLGPGDEATLRPLLTPALARDLVRLQVITPAVLGDPDALPGRAAFEALPLEDLQGLVETHELTPLGATVQDLVDALLVAGIAPPEDEA